MTSIFKFAKSSDLHNGAITILYGCLLIFTFFLVLFFFFFLAFYFSCVLDPGDKIVDCPPTFTMYEFDAAVNGALVVKGKCKVFVFNSN